MFAGQTEIQDYLKRCARKYELEPHIKLGRKLRQAVWDDTAECWRAETEDGLQIEAQIFVSAVGALHVPHYPELPGLHNFQGPAFHSAQWDHSVDLTGKTVAVVGTGASSVQFIPHVAKKLANYRCINAHQPGSFRGSISRLPKTGGSASDGSRFWRGLFAS
jgi:cation diffusion facilitator CzcD-associated flavoprotein CzcO